MGDLAAALFWQGPKLAVRDQPADYLFKSQHDHQIHFVYGRMTREIAESAAAWLDSMLDRRLPALVHCSGGVHRSAAVVVYWLHTRRGMTLESAYGHIRFWRPLIEPRENWIPNGDGETEALEP